MSEGQESRARIARYKEERRKELAVQFNNIQSDPSSYNYNNNNKRSNRDGSAANAANSSSSDGGPRPTRASRLRAAAAATTSQDNHSSPSSTQVAKLKCNEKASPSPEASAGGRERDKSSKRKSNLNRSLNCEEVPSSDLDDKSRRRRRRIFTPDVLEQASKQNDVKTDTLTASFLSQSSTSPITASPRLTPRKSELSVHMENARKSITPSYCEMGKYKPLTRRAVTSSPKERLKGLSSSDLDNSQSDRDISYSKSASNKENIKRTAGMDKLRNKSCSDNDVAKANKTIAKKMEELTALTKETLARVEKLASKNRESPRVVKKHQPTSSSSCSINTKLQLSSSRSRGSQERVVRQQPSSILKKTSFEEIVVESVPNSAPVSILKRKISQDEHNISDGAPSTTHTPPVTFSPSVVEPATTNRRQGILKKRRSLDESQVMRHRSCSPNKQQDSRSILKNQRRSSLEELPRGESPGPEPHLHGILKRKTSRSEEDDQSLNSPQSILKRRSGASSAGSTSSTPHVSITTAVILAAAGGAEMVLEDPDAKPSILKKKSFSEEHPYSEGLFNETPKPILKKKSSTDTDDCDERPKKPILKTSRSSVERDSFETKHSGAGIDHDCDVKPILKQNDAVGTFKPRLSFQNNTASSSIEEVVRVKSSRRSHTICSEFNLQHQSSLERRDEDRQLKKPRPLSVFELVMSFESSSSTGAIPKRSNGNKRQNDRYRTQPVTSNELEASLNLVRSPKLDNRILKSSPLASPSGNQSVNSLLDFTSSLENDSHLNSFLLHHPTNSPDSGVCGKMSSDSAFQSLGDGLELDQDDDKAAEVASSRSAGKLEPNKLELQMKAIAEEAKKIRLGKGNAGLQKYANRKSGTGSSSRFSTQPVTFEEVQEASKLKPDDEDKDDAADPANLSLSERIKLFNIKVKDDVQKREAPRPRRLNRFQTQPVTSDEVETARFISPTTYALDEQERPGGERRGILKSYSGKSALRESSSPSSQRKSVLKKRDSLKLEIPDMTYDEGISCNDSASDSETPRESKRDKLRDKVATKFGKKSNSDTTSDGESSGGREIRSIFRNENKLKVKHALESVLSKSKSHSTVGDEKSEPGVSKKGTTIRRSQTQAEMPRSIAEIQAELQQSGESGWKKRVQQQNNNSDDLKLLKDKNRYNDELSEKSTLAARKDELDASSQKWKNRVEKSDAEKFSVAGRMEKTNDLPINIPITENNNKKPQAKRFKSKEGSDSSSTPVSPDKAKHHELARSYSVPDPDQDSSGSDSSLRASGRKVSIARPDDFTFTSFYKSLAVTKENQLEVSLDDFDAVTRHSLLVQKKNVQVQKKRTASKNPIKALASRQDISNEYTEVITGVAEREKKRLNIEKLAKGSHLAVETLAALASKEDFTSVALKKSSFVSDMAPFKDVMLLQVKGRRHIQTRLVEPTAASINEGDNFILVTGSTLFNYTGAYSNVIEQSRSADILNHIQQSGDLGCKSAQVVTIDAKNRSLTSKTQKFWKILGCDETHAFTDGGHPEEDEFYESNILATNMIYKLEDDELVPFDEYWGAIPKIEMLQANRVIVFDFGSEMYVWSGKSAASDKKKLALKLAKELWEEGYNYSNCPVCPLNVASLLGNRQSPPKVSLESSKRPEWALFARITQHRETILFKEKFLDWPDFSRVIRVKGDSNEKTVDPSYNITPCDLHALLAEQAHSEPDLVIEGHHMGRGREYFDEETKRLFEFDSLNISVWRILENNSEKVCDKSVGHFYDGDSYIIRWNYKMTVRGRELSGKPSKHIQAGRDRCVYFCWQGSNASINEKGYAALLTVELDSENAPQIRVAHGYEPAAFLRLFDGGMVVHSGKRGEEVDEDKARLFMIRGEKPSETSLIEVACERKQLRSRTSFLVVNPKASEVIIWHGAKSSKQIRKMTKQVVNRLVDAKAAEFFLTDCRSKIEVVELEEGEEIGSFSKLLAGRNRDSYLSLLDSHLEFDFTMRLFYLSSISGTFEATQVLCPHRSEFSSPYPFLQNDLYSASQPALFLIDNHHELWLWQGWWPEHEEVSELADQTGSGAVRWQQERKAAMQTAVNYWRKNHPGDETVPAYLVWAGLEPLEFKNLFPNWTENLDVQELNIKEGKKPDGKLSLEKELALLSRTTYPLEELLRRPLPEGVDPTHLEIYLSPEDFQELLSMTKEEFRKLPSWKQTAVKKEKGLF